MQVESDKQVIEIMHHRDDGELIFTQYCESSSISLCFVCFWFEGCFNDNNADVSIACGSFTQQVQASRLKKSYFAVSVKRSSCCAPPASINSSRTLVSVVLWAQGQRQRLESLESRGGNKWMPGIISVFITTVDSNRALRGSFGFIRLLCYLKRARKLRHHVTTSRYNE